MATEIERKFMVSDASILDGLEGTVIAQGYLPVAAPTSVRVRLAGGGASARAFLTIKQGRSALARAEFEYPVPVADAEAMLDLMCGEARVRKVRFEIEFAGRLWEVDRFEAENAPLVMAEIELEAEDAPFERPPWVGAEMTADPRLLNVNLCRHPLAQWTTTERIALLGGDSQC